MALNFAANIHFLYLEYDFLDRFKAAADHGFEAVEMTFPYDVDADLTAKAATAAKVKIVEFNTPAGTLAPGTHRGHASIPGDSDIFLAHIEQGLRYALDVGCEKILTLSGLRRADIDSDLQDATYIDNLKRATDMCETVGITLLIEPNNLVDFPGYFLVKMEDVRRYIDAVDRPSLRAVFDFYHTQINEGDLSRVFLDHLDIIDHIQFGDSPDRHEPGTGEINFDHVFKLIEDCGYTGWVGAEYFPSGSSTSTSLGWLNKVGKFIRS